LRGLIALGEKSVDSMFLIEKKNVLLLSSTPFTMAGVITFVLGQTIPVHNNKIAENLTQNLPT